MSTNPQSTATYDDSVEPSAPFEDKEPISQIRRIPKELEQAAGRDEALDDEEYKDGLVLAAFRLAVAKTDAEVGLLHRRTDAFLYTTAVHHLDAGLHMCIAVSFWDPAINRIMHMNTVVGDSMSGEETASIARRLQARTIPRYVMAIPVVIDDCIEAIIELGRSDAPFGEESVQSTVRSLVAMAA